MTNRRAVLVGAASVAATYAVWRTGAFRWLLPAPGLNFTDLTDPPGFRAIDGGQISVRNDPFVGLGTNEPTAKIEAKAAVQNDLCGTLFGAKPTDPQTVQIAYFYDYRCPICSDLSPRLKQLGNIQLTFHDVANIAPISEVAARGAIAARNQDAFDAFHARLMRAALQPNEAYIRAIADGMGLNADQLIADMTSPAVDQEIWRARALANRFAMVGTPGIVIGRTVVRGNIADRSLLELVELERARGPVTC